MDQDDGGTRHGVLLRVGEVTPTTLRHRTQRADPGAPPRAWDSNRHRRARETVAAAARHAADAADLGRRRRASAPPRTGLGRPGAGSATVRGGRGVTGRSARSAACELVIYGSAYPCITRYVRRDWLLHLPAFHNQ